LFITRAKQRMLFGQTRFNQPSRFIREIPDSLLDVTGETIKTYSNESNKISSTSKQQTPSRGFTAAPTHSALAKNTTVFNAGDTVKHKAYGEGVVLSAKTMGNDTLLEIAFTEAGTKKIMANFAKVEKI
ncbi:MAG: ATP-dependent DNA helicase PcrA, partial [Clostridia bacterium]|nr:ATP-dependent DNA helicase PcrA [Clostridia bacterium]